MSKDEAKTIAATIAKLPGLLRDGADADARRLVQGAALFCAPRSRVSNIVGGAVKDARVRKNS